MKYLIRMFNEYRESHPGKDMPAWDKLMKYIDEK